MKDHVVRTRAAERASRDRAVRPVLEGLEERRLMYATLGGHFAYGSRITWSVVPDGTNLGGVTSNLISTLNQDFGSGGWINAFQDAFAEWENYAGINVSQVSDDGEPTGSGAYQQGNPNFGDIRIGGYAQGSNSLAYTLLPPPANGYSDSGDIFLNSAQPWHGGNGYDLETVAFHEIGHALGMGHSADPNAAMYPYYNGIKQGPDQDDVNGIVAVWGPRKEDAIALANNNFTISSAANLNGSINASNDQIVLPNQDVASSAETYWFKFTTPANASNNLTVQVQSAGLSELSPRVALYNANGQGIIQAIAPSYDYGATISVSINNATPNATYYVKVLGSNSGSSGTGAYALTVNMGYAAIGVVPPPNTLVANAPDQGGGGIYEKGKIGGANNKGNTPVDVPDQISIGLITAEGDFLMTPKKVAATHIRVVHVKAPVPVHSRAEKHPKTEAHRSQVHHG